MSWNGRTAPRTCGSDGEQLLEQLRLVALHAETAALLERRAELSDNPVLATLLRERAADHRQSAARVRGGLQPMGGGAGGVRAALR
jgi:hypothetical protein